MNINTNFIEHYKLTQEEINQTISSYRPGSYKPNEFFLEEGKISDKIGFVKSGVLRSFIYDDNANEITTQFYTEGSLIISFESFNNQIPAKENVIASTDTELLIVDYKRQKELYQLVPAWNQICKDLADQISKEMLERSFQFQTLSATERYKLFCKENPLIIQNVALKHIASYLGIDIATLSRIRKKL